MNILVCDDDAPSRDTWLRQIDEALPKGSQKPMPLMDPKTAFHELFLRQAAKRDGVERADEACEFDDRDVLVVDYDLVMVDPKNARHTGEELARLCRLFSRVGYVIVLNQGNRTVDFDLRMSSRPSSHADLNIAARTVCQQGLWRSQADNGFKPWLWDDIEKIVTSRRALATAIATAPSGLNRSIADMLAIPDAAIDVMSDPAFEHLDGTRRTVADFRKTTFYDFLSQQVEGKELHGIVHLTAERAAIWAVARTAKWLSRMLLAPQEILVDVPHLIDRLPFLMDPGFGSPEDPASWAKLPTAGFEAVVEPVRTAFFAGSVEWLGKAAFWWPLVDGHEYVARTRATADISNVPYLAFAEDRSTFVEGDKAESFRNDHYNRFAQRWVCPVDNLEYEPRRRLLES